MFVPRINEFLGYCIWMPSTRTKDRIWQARRNLGLSHRLLAKQLGVDESTVARWERGEAEPSASVEARFKSMLG